MLTAAEVVVPCAPGARRVSPCRLRCGVVPAPVGRDERIRFFRPPAARRVGAGGVVVFENGLGDRPGGLDGVLPGEQRPVTRQGVREEAFVGLLLVRLRAEQRELTLFAGELLARALDPGRECDYRVG